MAWEKFQYASKETKLKANILICDELMGLMTKPVDFPGKEREYQQLVRHFMDNVNQIARLGRSTFTHMLLATQAPNFDVFSGDLKTNITFRNVCGRMVGADSVKFVESEAAEAIPSKPGSYMGYAAGDVQQYQGYFCKDLKAMIDMGIGTLKPGVRFENGKIIRDSDNKEEQFLTYEQMQAQNNANDQAPEVPVIEGQQEQFVEQDYSVMPQQQDNITTLPVEAINTETTMSEEQEIPADIISNAKEANDIEESKPKLKFGFAAKIKSNDSKKEDKPKSPFNFVS